MGASHKIPSHFQTFPPLFHPAIGLFSTQKWYFHLFQKGIKLWFTSEAILFYILHVLCSFYMFYVYFTCFIFILHSSCSFYMIHFKWFIFHLNSTQVWDMRYPASQPDPTYWIWRKSSFFVTQLNQHTVSLTTLCKSNIFQKKTSEKLKHITFFGCW